MTRLPYETKGGNLSGAETYSQLLEYLRLGSEAAYMLGHLAKANDDKRTGEMWLTVGKQLERTVHLITNIATQRVGGH